MKDNLNLQYQGVLESNQLMINIESCKLANFKIVEIDPIYIPDEIPDNIRLGRRVELLFQYYLEHTQRYDVIISNLQINNDKRTIGELDYILFDQKSQQTIHLELAYKFYCYDPSFSNIELERWIGPNRKDSFVEKRDKLLNKQFPLVFKEETISILSDIGMDRIDGQSLCFFAQLYVPLNSYELNDFGKYEEVNPNCIVGFWINFLKFKVLKDFSQYYYHIPPKKDWLVDPRNNTEWLSFQDIIGGLTPSYNSKRSTMLWIKKDTMRFDKCFIVWW